MSQANICILNYGSGNVGSVANIFKSIGENIVISNQSSEIESASHIVLPGVGAFGASMEKIRQLIPLKFVSEQVLSKKKPFLGICVGMQVLADQGEEFGLHQGLGWVAGKVRKIINESAPLPHVGWNDVTIKKNTKLTNNLPDNTDFYFVHSYIFEPRDQEVISATTTYQEEFCSILQKDNIYGVQFHPEKSQKSGKILLENFLKIST